jgi:glyceraldehyde 3-phosphate dehydrogenase
MIPTTTGAATAIGLVLPELAGKLTGMAVRVPTPDVSLVDLVVRTSQDVSVEAINAALRSAADRWPAGTLRVEDDDVVSSDLLGDPTGSVVDAALSDVAGPRMAKVVAWYDNEWGYASRLYALLGKMARQVGAGEAGP